MIVIAKAAHIQSFSLLHRTMTEVLAKTGTAIVAPRRAEKSLPAGFKVLCLRRKKDVLRLLMVAQTMCACWKLSQMYFFRS